MSGANADALFQGSVINYLDGFGRADMCLAGPGACRRDPVGATDSLGRFSSRGEDRAERGP